MTTSLEYLHQAQFKYDAAFHLLKITFPLTKKDPKLFLGIINNILESFQSCINATLQYQLQLKNIEPFKEDFKSKFNLFRSEIMPIFKIKPSFSSIIMDIQTILELQKKCPIEFRRGGKIVLCDKEYSMKVIDENILKEYLHQNRVFLEITEKIIRG